MTELTYKLLAAPFPKASIHWRAQTVTKAGDKALALAYLDARDVMDRLDMVVGPENWQEEVAETPRGRVICRLGIRTFNGTSTPEWVWKSDGAGDTAVEGEKGGISDALKRAAVHWGIGRYLYRLGSPWVPCECREFNGKKQWSKWSESPWDHVKNAPVSPDEVARDLFRAFKADDADISKLVLENAGNIELVKRLVPAVYTEHLSPLIVKAAN